MCALYVCVYVRVCVFAYALISGSAVRSAVTKLEGNNPTPWYVSPFHQLGSLRDKQQHEYEQKLKTDTTDADRSHIKDERFNETYNITIPEKSFRDRQFLSILQPNLWMAQ